MFNGSLLGIVATTALELGIDIGSLDAVITVGFPYTLPGLRQQAGRAGRRNKDSLAMLICDPFPIEYVVTYAFISQELNTFHAVLSVNIMRSILTRSSQIRTLRWTSISKTPSLWKLTCSALPSSCQCIRKGAFPFFLVGFTHLNLLTERKISDSSDPIFPGYARSV